MIETTYNGSHNFLSLLLIALPLGSGSLEAPWSEHKSQPRGGREEGGGKGRRRKVEESARVSRAILSPSQINCLAKKGKMKRKKNTAKKKKIAKLETASLALERRIATAAAGGVVLLVPNSFPHTRSSSPLPAISSHLTPHPPTPNQPDVVTPPQQPARPPCSPPVTRKS